MFRILIETSNFLSLSLKTANKFNQTLSKQQNIFVRIIEHVKCISRGNFFPNLLVDCLLMQFYDWPYKIQNA